MEIKYVGEATAVGSDMPLAETRVVYFVSIPKPCRNPSLKIATHLGIPDPLPLLGAKLVRRAREELGHGTLDLFVGIAGEVHRAGHHPQLQNTHQGMQHRRRQESGPDNTLA